MHTTAPDSGTAKHRTARVAAWALWDWGGSAYSAVIVSFIFAPYLVKGVAADDVSGSAALGWAVGLGGFVVALIAPAAGARADQRTRHRLMLTLYTLLTVACIFSLVFIKNTPAFLLPGLALMSAASVFFELAQVSYNSMLTRIARPGTVGRVSNIGWGVGYLGGLTMLVISLFAFVLPEVGLFGAGDAEGLRFRMVAAATAVWFLLWAIPLMFFAPPDLAGPHSPAAPARQQSALTGWFAGWVEDYRALLRRLRHLFRNDRQTFRFLIASAVFRDGLTTIFAVAGVIAGGSYGFSPTEVIYLGVAANVVAALGCLAAGWADDAFGPRRVIVTGLVALLIGAVPIILSDDKTVFWICAMFLCLFVGPVNASSRSFLTRITPPERAGEVFGLYATTGRAISFLGPWMFGLTVTALGYQRGGAVGIMVVIALGLVLMLAVPRTAGTRTAHPAEHPAAN